MPIIEEKVRISAPVEKVFAFLANPDNWTEYVTSLTNVSDLSSRELSPGTTFSWEYRMLGVKLHGTGSITEYNPASSFAMRMEGTIPIAERYTLAAVGPETELSVRVEYTMPGVVLEKIANSSLVEKLNRREADNVLAKVKIFCEELS